MKVWINEKTHTVYCEDTCKKFTSHQVYSAMIVEVSKYFKMTDAPYEGVECPKYNLENGTWKARIV